MKAIPICAALKTQIANPSATPSPIQTLAFLTWITIGIILMTSALPAMAHDDDRSQRTVTVSASAQVDAKPDAASITTGVTTEAPTAREALNKNSVTVQKLIDGLVDLGLDRDDIQTSQFNIHPRYNNHKDGGTPTVRGYNVTNDITIDTDDIAKLGDLLDRLVTFGANRMHGLSFHVTQAETLKDEARKQAIANARRRAQLFAQAGGASIGKVLHISENTTHNPSPGPMRMARAEMAKSVPIESGTQSLTANVTVTWALED